MVDQTTSEAEPNRKWTRRSFIGALGAIGIGSASTSAQAKVGSKRFTNEYILRCLRGSEIAGGIGYWTDIDLRDADVMVEDRDSLIDALDSNVDVIGIEGDARIDLSGRDYTLSNQTIISDRGINGSSGALLYTTDHGDNSPAWDGGSNGRGLFRIEGDSRISGIRLRGPYYDYYDNPKYPGYIPLDDEETYEEREAKRKTRYARGMHIRSDNVEIDNCELYGWPVQAICIGTASDAVSPHIHHIYGHDCMMDGAGYIVDVIRGHPTIEMSYFNATRHSIAGFGFSDCGYTLENSVFGPSTISHAVDMHALAEGGYDNDLTAGGRVEVRKCTFAFTHNIDGQNAQAIVFRGYPEDQYITDLNWFFHDMDGDGTFENVGNSGYQPVPYRQVNVGSGWSDWYASDNRYGVDESDGLWVGAPFNSDNLQRP